MNRRPSSSRASSSARRTKRSNKEDKSSIARNFVVKLNLYRNQTIGENAIIKLVESRADINMNYKLLSDDDNKFVLKLADQAWQLYAKEALEEEEEVRVVIQGDSDSEQESDDRLFNTLVDISVT